MVHVKVEVIARLDEIVVEQEKEHGKEVKP